MYLETHAGKAGCDETILRFKNMKRDALRSLHSGYDESIVAKFAKTLQQIEDDVDFWNYQKGGVCIFLGSDFRYIKKIMQRVSDICVVADRFYLKPLLHLYQNHENFLILCVSMKSPKLFDADRDHIEAQDSPELQLAFDEFWGEPNADRHIVSLAIGGSGINGKNRALFHNYNDVRGRKKIDLARYFRAVDDAVCKLISDQPCVPVVLAALPEYQDLYRTTSRIKGLMSQGIMHNPDVISADELRERAWSIVKPSTEVASIKMIDEYRNAVLVGKAAHRLHDVARAISQGRVGKILIEQDRTIPGKFIKDSGQILFGDLENPHITDILDEFAGAVAVGSGMVRILPKEKMPSDTGVAAICRY
jgi:hypothetical protein